MHETEAGIAKWRALPMRRGFFRRRAKPDDGSSDDSVPNSSDDSQSSAQPDVPTSNHDNGLAISLPDENHAHVAYSREHEERSEDGGSSIRRERWEVDVHVANLSQTLTDLSRLNSAQPDHTSQGRIGPGNAGPTPDSDRGSTDASDE